MVQLKGQYQLSDFTAAQKLHADRGRLSSCLGYYAIGMLVMMALLGLLTGPAGSLSWPLLIGATVALGLWALSRFVLLPRRIARVFTQQKELSAPFEAAIDEAGFHFQNSYGNGRIPWEDFTKWKESKEILLLYRSDIMFHMLPKRLFQNQGEIDTVLERLREKGVPDARKSRSLTVIAIIAALVIVAVFAIVAQWFMYSAAR
jgi:hypothetical protein